MCGAYGSKGGKESEDETSWLFHAAKLQLFDGKGSGIQPLFLYIREILYIFAITYLKYNFNMKKIPSFTIDHTRLERGLYVSRRDVTPAGDIITTFDCRLTRPNREEAVSPSALHAMEHLAATFLRNHPQWASKIVYWGPMGCCTGNYLIVQGNLEPADVMPLIRETMEYVARFDGEIPGASERDCGNYTFMDLEGARLAAHNWLSAPPATEYPK